MKFQRERLKDCLQEIIPLTELHYKEIAHYQDIELAPAYDDYLRFDNVGVLRVFTVRTQNDNKLVGYSLFFVRANLHYKNSLQAVQDILFIHPSMRGCGGEFIQWCDQQLKSESVQAVYHHVKMAHNFGPLLAKFGYELVDLVYAKRLDKVGK